jgi:hypothetical protein
MADFYNVYDGDNDDDTFRFHNNGVLHVHFVIC